MTRLRRALLSMGGAGLLIAMGEVARPADPPTPPTVKPAVRPADAVQDFQTPQPMPMDRPEMKKNDHDQSGKFRRTMRRRRQRCWKRSRTRGG